MIRADPRLHERSRSAVPAEELVRAAPTFARRAAAEIILPILPVARKVSWMSWRRNTTINRLQRTIAPNSHQSAGFRRVAANTESDATDINRTSPMERGLGGSSPNRLSQVRASESFRSGHRLSCNRSRSAVLSPECLVHGVVCLEFAWLISVDAQLVIETLAAQACQRRINGREQALELQVCPSSVVH